MILFRVLYKIYLVLRYPNASVVFADRFKLADFMEIIGLETRSYGNDLWDFASRLRQRGSMWLTVRTWR